MTFLRLACVLVASVFMSVAALAESIDIGPKVGSAIPAPITLKDGTGSAKTFADLIGEKGAILAFVRSASWCPYCQVQLKDFQTISAELSQQGYPLVAISYDAPDVLARFAAQHGITYGLLSDQGSVVIDAFQIRDPQYKDTSRAYGVPKPVIFVVDTKGIVQAKLAEDDYKLRPALEAIQAAVKGL